MSFDDETTRIMNKTMTIARDTFIRTPIGMLITLFIASGTGVYAWAQTQGDLQHLSDHVHNNTEKLGEAEKERHAIMNELSKRGAHFEEIMRRLDELREDIKDLDR